MTNGYCHGCMERITAYPCPRCGYTPAGNLSPYALRPGTVLNKKYLVGAMIGQGGFGITYVGRDLQLQRKVAIKEYYPSGHVGRKTGSGTVVWYDSIAAQEAKLAGQEMVLKEARKMSKVGGIGSVVQVFDVFQENGTAYICMDFVNGETLLSRLKKTGPLPWTQAEKIFLPVIETMDAVHKEGLVHRDISPDNLMLQPDGGVKILDLGAAKDLNLNSGKSSMKVAKNGFSPLEQYMDSGKSGSWTDVYALAATMYYTLTGVRPPASIDRLNNDTLSWDLPPLQILPAHILEALRQAMGLRAADRIQTMADFGAALQGNHKPDLSGDKPWKKWVPVIAGAAVLAAAAAVVIGLWPDDTAPANAPGPQLQESGLQERIDTLVAASEKEVYNYQNGSRMELYFDGADNEVLRIFRNSEGQEEYLFLAEYDANGNAVAEEGYENRELMRAKTWERDNDGMVHKIEERDGNGSLLEKTEIFYGSDGRETHREQKDGNGNLLFRATSTYSSGGIETYTGTYEDGSGFTQTYSPDGNLLENVNTDAWGNLDFHSVYLYDNSGKQTEYQSFDENGQLSYTMKYIYEGDLQTGYTSCSYSEYGEYISEISYIFGPRDIRFGEEDSTGDYPYVSENVESIVSSTWLRRFHTDTGADREYTTYYHDWDGKQISSARFDEAGAMTGKSQTLYDEAGNRTGEEQYWYNEDGSYRTYTYGPDYRTLYNKEYDSSGKLTEQTEYLYDASGEQQGSIRTEYHEDGSYTESDINTDYRTTESRTYDAAGTLISVTETHYGSDGRFAGSVSTIYFYDGSYTVTEKDANYRIVSEKTYDASGKLIP